MNKNIDFNRFLADLNISGQLKVEEDLGSGYVRLKISEAERRQALQDIKSVEDIVLECLRNSRDAKSRNIFIATKKIAESKRHLYIIDDGNGIPVKFHKLIFQSRVTSKLENAVKDPYGFHGRGMALFSIKLNVEEISIAYSGLNKGTCIFIEVDTEKIPEKKDQSAMPALVKNDGSITTEGGINNIAKIIMEFSIQNPEINIYLGSPTQVITTMISVSKFRKKGKNINEGPGVPRTSNLKAGNMDDFRSIISGSGLNIIDFPCLTSNYSFLEMVLKEYFNMNISERGVQRIFYGELKPLEAYNRYFYVFTDTDPVSKISLNKTQKDSFKDKSNPGVVLHDESGLAKRFKDNEIRYIIDILQKEINKTGSRYFIETADNIEIKRDNNSLNIKINLKQKN